MYTLDWTIYVRTLPRFQKHCPRCGSAYFVNSGRFRVNANGKKLDIWLVSRCEHCKTIWNLSVFERIDRATLTNADYLGYLENNAALVLRHVFDPAFCAKNRAVLDLHTLDYAIIGALPCAGEAARVEAHCEYPLPLPVDQVISSVLGLSLSRVRRLYEARMLSMDADPRKIKSGTGFTFTLSKGWEHSEP